MRDPITAWREYRRCEHWMANIAMAVVALVYTTFALRYTMPALLAVLPAESWAAEAVTRAITMSAGHFWLTAAIAAAGGVTSFLRDVKHDTASLRIINAMGHLVAAQFAGLLVYLMAVDLQWSEPWALVACGVAGWSGNHFIEKLSAVVLSRSGVDVSRK